MADLILIKGGTGGVPKLQDREIAYSKTEKALYIGTESGNVKLCVAGLDSEIADIKARLDALESK